MFPTRQCPARAPRVKRNAGERLLRNAASHGCRNLKTPTRPEGTPIPLSPPACNLVSLKPPACVFSIVYRCWASIRARQVLQWIKDILEGSLGFMPGREAPEAWFVLEVQDASVLSGYGTDLVKAFNNRPGLHSSRLLATLEFLTICYAHGATLSRTCSAVLSCKELSASPSCLVAVLRKAAP